MQGWIESWLDLSPVGSVVQRGGARSPSVAQRPDPLRSQSAEFGIDRWREIADRTVRPDGLRIGIHEAIERPGGVVFRCDLTASDANRWLEIPAWMFDRSACAKVRLAVEPHTDLSALVMVGALLRDVRNIRSTASDAADSGLSPLSGDQNQGETHATPEQTEVGTSPRAAANRPVRRERADHRRHAGVVRTTDGDAGGANHPNDEADPGPCRQAPDGFDEGRS